MQLHIQTGWLFRLRLVQNLLCLFNGSLPHDLSMLMTFCFYWKKTPTSSRKAACKNKWQKESKPFRNSPHTHTHAQPGFFSRVLAACRSLLNALFLFSFFFLLDAFHVLWALLTKCICLPSSGSFQKSFLVFMDGWSYSWKNLDFNAILKKKALTTTRFNRFHFLIFGNLRSNKTNVGREAVGTKSSDTDGSAGTNKSDVYLWSRLASWKSPHMFPNVLFSAPQWRKLLMLSPPL